MRVFHAYTDGSIEGGNPGGHGVGAWVLNKNSDRVAQGTIDLGKGPKVTNNQAEYAAMFSLFSYLWHEMEDNHAHIVVHADSQLLVNQVNAEWACNDPVLRTYRDQIWGYLDDLEDRGMTITVKWIPREENKEADELSRSLYGA